MQRSRRKYQQQHRWAWAGNGKRLPWHRAAHPAAPDPIGRVTGHTRNRSRTALQGAAAVAAGAGDKRSKHGRCSTLRVLTSPRAAPAALLGSGIGRAEHRLLPHRQPPCPPPSLLCCAGNFVLVGCLPVTAAANHSLPELRSQGNLLLGSRDGSRLGQGPQPLTAPAPASNQQWSPAPHLLSPSKGRRLQPSRRCC